MSEEAASVRLQAIKAISMKLVMSAEFTTEEIRLIRAALIDQFIEAFPGSGAGDLFISEVDSDNPEPDKDDVV